MLFGPPCLRLSAIEATSLREHRNVLVRRSDTQRLWLQRLEPNRRVDKRMLDLRYSTGIDGSMEDAIRRTIEALAEGSPRDLCERLVMCG